MEPIDWFAAFLVGCYIIGSMSYPFVCAWRDAHGVKIIRRKENKSPPHLCITGDTLPGKYRRFFLRLKDGAQVQCSCGKQYEWTYHARFNSTRWVYIGRENNE